MSMGRAGDARDTARPRNGMTRPDHHEGYSRWQGNPSMCADPLRVLRNGI